MNEYKNILNSASKKIGIKLLDNNQIETLLPEYNRILKMIQEQRNRIANGGIYITDEQYHFMHDNVIGIFGSRGSGKTSIIFSLREKMVKNQKNDIILPVISPELIGSNTSILMLVLSMLENHVKILEEYLQNNESCNKDFLDRFKLSNRNCGIYRDKSAFLEEYNTLLRSCRKTSSLDKYSYDEAIEIQVHESGMQYKLMDHLNKFWDMLAFIQKYKSSENKQPLLFIMFDDIDLAPERSMELVLSSYKYFSNPNICIILSAALKTLKQVLTCRVYERAIGSDFHSLIQNNYIHNNNVIDIYGMERASEAAAEYLNKVIPQSSRFILTNFDTIDKKQMFRYPLEFNSEYNPSKNLSIPLDLLLINILNESGFLNEIIIGHKHYKYENFFIRNDNFAKEYYLLFGNKSRYINNACLSIINGILALTEVKNEMIIELSKSKSEYTKFSKKYIRKIYNILNNLLLTLISSHTRELERHINWIPELLKYNRGEHYLFVDYNFLNNQYKIEVNNIKKELTEKLKNIEDYMTKSDVENYKNNFLSNKIIILRKKIAVLFIISNFIEQLICIISPLYYTMIGYKGRERKMHGYEQLMQFINQANITNFENFELNIYPDLTLETEDILNIYIDILESPERFINFSIYDAECVADYFSYLNDNPILVKKLSTKLTGNNCQIVKSYNNYGNWIKTICNMLYLNKSGIQILQKDFFKTTNELFIDISSIPQLSILKSLYVKQIYKFIDSWNLKEKAEDLHQSIYKANDILDDVIDYHKYSWNDIFNNEDLNKDYPNISLYADNIAMDFINDNIEFITLSDTIDYYMQIDLLFQDLYLKIIRNISRWPLEFHIKGSKINSALDAILGLSSTSEQLRLELKGMEEYISNFASELYELEQKIDFFNEKENNEPIHQTYLKNIYKEKLETYITFDFYKIFTIALRVSIILNSFIDDEMNSYFAENSLLSLFNNMEIVSFDNEDISGYLNELLTFIGLIPHYIAAQFYLKNNKQYFEYSVKTKDDIENSKNSVSKRDYPAEKYSEIIEKISPSDGSEPDDIYNVLFKTLVNIKNKYIRDKMREYGVIQE